MSEILRLGIPKGSLQESTLSLFSQAGFNFTGGERTLRLASNDTEIDAVLLRPQEIPGYVAEGRLDAGLSGRDWIMETNASEQIVELAELIYAKRSFRPVRWVLAVAEDSEFQAPEDLRKVRGRKLKISTELMAITQNWLAERGIIADVSFSWGATEVKVPDFADAIVDVTETGSSLRANRLRPIATLLESTTRFFMSRELYRQDGWKRRKAEAIALLLRSCLAADTKVSIHAHVPRGDTGELLSLFNGSGTLSHWESPDGETLLEIVVDKERSRTLVPELVRLGARRVSVAPLTLLYE